MKNIAFSLLSNLSSLRNSTKGYAILMYHNISENSSVLLPDYMTLDIESFTRQMNYLRNECTPISFSDIVTKIHSNIPADKFYVGISFDDGHINQYNLAVPILQKLELPATFFITTDFSDGKNIPYETKWYYYLNNSRVKINFIYKNNNYGSFDLDDNHQKEILYNILLDYLKKDQNEIEDLDKLIESWFGDIIIPELYMSWDQLQDLYYNQLFTIGAHSVTHIALNKTNNFLEDEVIASKKIIEEKINGEVEYFAYPFGTRDRLNTTIINSMESSSFKAAFTALSGLNRNLESPYSFERIAVLGGEDFDYFLIRLYWAEFIKKLKYMKFSILNALS